MAYYPDDYEGYMGGIAAPDLGTENFSRELDQATIDGEREAYALITEQKRAQSKSDEKLRRLQQTKERKTRELTGSKIQPTNDDDWAITKTAKTLANKVLPRDYQIGIDEFGKTYNGGNKTFNNDDMSNVWNEVEDDPHGDKVMYYMRVEDGFEDDGVTPKNAYKVGYADVSGYDRYREQLADSGINIIGEKRFDSAEDVENQIHGNEAFLQERLYDRSQLDQGKENFGSGSSELYGSDILGIDSEEYGEEYFAKTLQESKAKSDKAIEEYRPDKGNNWARAFGSGAVRLGGLITKAVGPNDLGQKLMDNADEITGYSDRDVTKAGKMFRRGLRRGNLVDIVDSFITGGPEVFAQSLPEMLAIMGATAATGGAGGAVAATGSTIGRSLMPILGMAGLKTNDTLDTRKKANGGQSASAKEIAGTFLTEAVAVGLDYGAFKVITGGKGLSLDFGNKVIPVSELISKMDMPRAVDTMLRIGASGAKASGKVAGSAVVEAGQETITESIRLLNEQFGTTKYEGMSLQDILQLPENQARIKDAYSLGAVGGGAPGIAQGAKSILSDTFNTGRGLPEDTPFYQQVRNDTVQRAQAYSEDPTQFKEQDFKDIHENLVGLSEQMDEAETADDVKAISNTILELLSSPLAQNIYDKKTLNKLIKQEKKRLEENTNAEVKEDGSVDIDNRNFVKDTETTFTDGGSDIDISAYENIDILDSEPEDVILSEPDVYSLVKGMSSYDRETDFIDATTRIDEFLTGDITPSQRIAALEAKNFLNGGQSAMNRDIDLSAEFVANQKELTKAKKDFKREKYTKDRQKKQEAESPKETKPKEEVKPVTKKETKKKKAIVAEEKIIETMEKAVDGSKEIGMPKETYTNLEKEVVKKKEKLEKSKKDFKKKYGYNALGAMPENSNVDLVSSEVKSEPRTKVSSSRIVKGSTGTTKQTDASKQSTEAKKHSKVYTDEGMVDGFLNGFNTEDMSTTDKAKQNKRETKAEKTTKKDFVDKVALVAESGKFKNSKALEEKFDKLFPENKVGGTLRLASIAMDYVLNDIKSNVDRTNNKARKHEQFYASRQNMIQHIGRELFESYGAQLLPADSKSENTPTEIYAEYGNIGLAILEESGYITTMPDGETINDTGAHDVVNDAGDLVERDINSEGIPKLDGRNVILLSDVDGNPAVKPRGKLANLNSNNIKSPYFSMIAKTMNALQPGNYRIPEHSANTKDIRSDEHVLSDVSEENINDIASKALHIKPEFYDMIKDIASQVQKESFDKVINKPDNVWMKTLFGIDGSFKDYIETEKQGESGKKISKRASAIAMIDAVNEYENDSSTNKQEMFYTIFSAVNMRLHVDEIAFNYQADNVVARHILSPLGEKYVAQGREQVEALVLTLADELGVTPDDILYAEKPKPYKNSGDEESVVNGINVALENGFQNAKEYLDPAWSENPGTSALFHSGKSVVNVISMLEAISDVRQAVSDIKNSKTPNDWTKLKVKTNFAMGFDGNTSGLVNKILNMIGADSDINNNLLALIKRLTIPNKETGKREDGYIILANSVKEEISNKVENAKKNSSSPTVNKGIKELKTVMAYIESIDKTMRQTSKSPMMTNLYGQMTSSMASLLGANIATSMIADAKTDKENNVEVRALIKELADINENPEETTFEEKRLLSEAIAKSLGAIYGSALNKVNSEINEATAPLYVAYDDMHSASKALGKPLTMRSPFDVTYYNIMKDEFGIDDKDLLSDKYNFSIEKKKIEQIGRKALGDGEVDLTKQSFNRNPNSQKVMPLHAIDSAILKIAYELTFAKLGLNKIPGTMSVHDAVYSTPEFMIEYRTNYNKAAIAVAKHYDLTNETIHTIDGLIKELEAKKGDTNSYSKSIKDLRARKSNLEVNNEARMAYKNKTLDALLRNKDFSVFGTFKQEMPDPSKTREPKATPKPVVKKEQPKPKAKPKEEAPVDVDYKGEFDSKETIDNNELDKKATLSKLFRAINKSYTNPEYKRKRVTAIINELISQYTNEPDSKETMGYLNTIKYWAEDKPSVVGTKRFWFRDDKNDTIEVPESVIKNNSDNVDMDMDDIIRYTSHEIEHTFHAAYIREQSELTPAKQDNSYKYIKKVHTKMSDMLLKDPMMFEEYDQVVDGYSETTMSRINYLLTQKNEFVNMAEFIAIYRTNSKVREAINKKVFKQNKSSINRFVKMIGELMNKAIAFISNKQVESSEISVDVFNDAMNNMVILGKDTSYSEGDSKGGLGAMNTIDSLNKTLKINMPYKGKKPAYIIPFEENISTFNRASEAFYRAGFQKAQKLVADNKWIQEFHKNKMSNTDGIYYRTLSLLQERFEPGTVMSRTIQYLNWNNDFSEVDMRALETQINKAQQSRNRVDTAMLSAAKTNFDKVTKKYKKSEVAGIFSMMNTSLIHELYTPTSGTSMLNDIIDSTDQRQTIKDLVDIISTSLEIGSQSIKDTTIIGYKGGVSELASDIAKYYHTRSLGNLATTGVTDIYVNKVLKGAKRDLFNQLVALKQLELQEDSTLKTLTKYHNDSSGKNNSFKEMIATSAANYSLSQSVDKKSDGSPQERFDNVTGSHINFNENYQFETVTGGKLHEYTSDKDKDWIIVRKPDDKAGVLGVVARVRTDFGFQPGLASVANLNTDGIVITYIESKALDKKKNNIMRSGTKGKYTYKIMLDNDMISNLDVNDHPVSSMFRAFGHNTQIFESISAFEHMLNNESYEVRSVKQAQAFERDLKKGKKPYFINFRSDIPGLDISDYPLISREYGEAKNLTNVLGFNKRVNMVHKNIKDQVSGYVKTPLVDPRNTVLHGAEKYLRQAVTMFASHVVMGSPAKIAADTISNLSILAIHDVPLIDMYKYGKEVTKYAPEMVRLRNELMELQFDMFSKKENTKEFDKAKARVEAKKKKIADHPFAVALNSGMIQSLSTDMLMKDKESMSELQKTANTLFNALGEVPLVKSAIFKWSNAFGLGIEDVASMISSAMPSNISMKEYAEHLKVKMKKIRSEEDFAAYMSEIVATPGQSEILRIGGAATLGVDLVTKWTLYKNAMDNYTINDREFKSNKNGVKQIQLTEKEKQRRAISLSVNSTVNYMTNLPQEIDMLKDTGIWMFPHFLLRIQKVISQMLLKNTFGITKVTGITAATKYTTGLGGGIPSILESVVPLKTPSQFSPDSNVLFPNLF